MQIRQTAKKQGNTDHADKIGQLRSNPNADCGYTCKGSGSHAAALSLKGMLKLTEPQELKGRALVSLKSAHAVILSSNHIVNCEYAIPQSHMSIIHFS